MDTLCGDHYSKHDHYISDNGIEMIRLLDNDRPARYPDMKVHSSWDNCDFKTFDECIDYADKWLGYQSPGKIILKKLLKDVGSFFYGGAGDCISIVNNGDEIW